MATIIVFYFNLCYYEVALYPDLFFGRTLLKFFFVLLSPNSGLVQDLDHSVDPHEGKEWFHSTITKEQAYNLLMACRFFNYLTIQLFVFYTYGIKKNLLFTIADDTVGSYLIRPSDSTPGHYVLYFYTGTSIQRFKIHRKNYNRSFEMGGRNYNR